MKIRQRINASFTKMAWTLPTRSILFYVCQIRSDFQYEKLMGRSRRFQLIRS